MSSSFYTRIFIPLLKEKKQQIFGFNLYERDQYVKEWAGKLPTKSKVLDVGAGPCRYRPLFAHCEYLAQDFAMYEDSTGKSAADRHHWTYGDLDYVCDATSIPVPDGSFDAVLCTEVLEHVSDPVMVVHEIARILRPGGKVFLTAPLGSGLHMEPYHFYGGYTPYWYQRFLPEAGFTDIEIVPNGGFFKHYGQESQRFSTLIDPRRLSGPSRHLVGSIWVLTLPWFRFVVPVVCHYLDRLDTHKGYTVGYQVTAVKR